MHTLEGEIRRPVLETPRSLEERSVWHAAKALWAILVTVGLSASAVVYWLVRTYWFVGTASS
jgi:hypothetical protein